MDATRRPSPSGASGALTWDVPEGARLLEPRAVATSSRHSDSAVCLVVGCGVVRATKAKAEAPVSAQLLDADRTPLDALPPHWRGALASLVFAESMSVAESTWRSDWQGRRRRGGPHHGGQVGHEDADGRRRVFIPRLARCASGVFDLPSGASLW